MRLQKRVKISTWKKQEQKNNTVDRTKAARGKNTNITPNIKYSDNKENLNRARYGGVVKKPDRLTY